MKRCSLQSSRLRLKGLAKELAEDGYRGRDFIVDGRQAAGLQGGDAGGDRGQIPHHHEAQHQAHTHLHQAMQVRDREGQLLASTQLGSSRGSASLRQAIAMCSLVDQGHANVLLQVKWS